MEEEVIFTEKQQFRQWWLWLLLIAVNGIVLYSVPEPLLVAIIPFAIIILFAIAKLETSISTNGITVRFFPFQKKYRFYSADMIATAYLRQYSPLGEYGGWGIRGMGKNRALNVSGNWGIQLELRDGSRLLIGTNRVKDLTDILATPAKPSYFSASQITKRQS